MKVTSSQRSTTGLTAQGQAWLDYWFSTAPISTCWVPASRGLRDHDPRRYPRDADPARLSAGHQLEWLQSNAEHELVERVHRAREERIDFILLNPAAFTHTSVALRDALTGVAIPFIELHLSNVHAREPFRAHSYFTDVARGVIAGFGADSYSLALDAALAQLARD